MLHGEDTVGTEAEGLIEEFGQSRHFIVAIGSQRQDQRQRHPDRSTSVVFDTLHTKEMTDHEKQAQLRCSSRTWRQARGLDIVESSRKEKVR